MVLMANAIRVDGKALALKVKAARSARTPKPGGFATGFLRSMAGIVECADYAQARETLALPVKI
jgi:hypothetical protein